MLVTGTTFRDTYTPDFVCTDRRQIGWPTVDRDGLVETMREYGEPRGRIPASAQVRDPRPGATRHGRRVWHDADGSVVEWVQHVVTVVEPAGVSSVEIFDEHDFAAALARFDELGAAPSSDPRHPRCENETTRTVDAFFARGDRRPLRRGGRAAHARHCPGRSPDRSVGRDDARARRVHGRVASDVRGRLRGGDRRPPRRARRAARAVPIDVHHGLRDAARDPLRRRIGCRRSRVVPVALRRGGARRRGRGAGREVRGRRRPSARGDHRRRHRSPRLYEQQRLDPLSIPAQRRLRCSRYPPVWDFPHSIAMASSRCRRATPTRSV